MKRLLAVLLTLMLCAPLVRAQNPNFGSPGIAHVPTVSGRKCLPGSAPLAMLQGSPYTIYQCTGTNAWTAFPATGSMISTADPRLNDSINVQASPYNATGLGVVNDATAIQSAFDALDWTKGGTIVIPPGRYKVTTGINLARAQQYETYSSVNVIAYGAVIEPTTAVTCVFCYMPTTHAQAINVIYNRVNFFGLNVKAATRTSGQVAIRIGATEGMRVQDCDFTNIDGTDLVFAIRPVIVNSNASRYTQYGFRIRSGKDAWSGETADGAPSNVPVIQSCRAWPGSGGVADFYIEGSDQWAIYDSISDSFDAGVTGAGSPQYNVLIDESNYTYGEGGIISGFYSESNNNPSVAMFGIKGRGKTTLERVRRYETTSTVWVDATGSTSGSEIELRNWSRVPASPEVRFKTASGVRWEFNHVGAASSQYFKNSAWWHGGTKGIVSQSGKYGLTVDAGAGQVVAYQMGDYDDANAEASFGIARSVGDWFDGTQANDVIIRSMHRGNRICLGMGDGSEANDLPVLCVSSVGSGNLNETGVYILEGGTLHQIMLGDEGSGPLHGTDRALYIDD